ncbi:uncharacterized protein N7518_001532 [Penicillium psychrosexuale]|uniref:uncharacterized protein n=1 Tax=Penicillium psychrosexuale TaxID=1002107 RepID=UPI0025456F08|nr:uncharacterized protein N7518_001532 [Penicillium psychrosexuale]KAJ5799464.1 hypothetical protein N7518_001532 [Penicillium psychrosexuale]
MQATDEPTQSGIDLTLPEEKTQDEIKIEQSGCIHALQRYRWNVYYEMDDLDEEKWLELLRIEQDLRSTVQEEQILANKTKTTCSWQIFRNDTQTELQA